MTFAGTPTFGKHGGVSGDWATYLTMTGATNRGWIFKLGTTNVASISAAGVVTATTFSGKATSAGTSDLANTLTINSSASASWFNILWNSGTTVYGSASNKLRVQPSTGSITSGGTITASEFIGNASSATVADTVRGNTKTITITGNANTYYPVVITGTARKTLPTRISV